jgi:hypothetical protein
MTGGSKVGIIEVEKDVASAEPDTHKRARICPERRTEPNGL